MTQVYISNSPVYAYPEVKGGVQGYRVEYSFEESFWMEKGRFATQFLPVNLPTHDIPEFQQRLLAERTQLADRITKLVTSMGTDNFMRLEADTKSDLHGQLDSMLSYLRIIDERLVTLNQIQA